MALPHPKETGNAFVASTSSSPVGHEASPEIEPIYTKHGFKIHPPPVRNDPMDPLNWSFTQKHTILAIVMTLYFLFTYITTMTVPSFPAIQSQYSISIEQANWTIAIPALGLAVGPLVWSSMGDIIGRRTIFLLGTVIALASTVGAALAPTYSGYMAARFFQAFGVSPAASIGLAITNDIFFEHERGQKVGLWVLSIDLGLLFGPFFGGFITRAGHIWIQWVVAIFLGAILVAELIFLPETLYPRNLMLAQSRNIPSVAGSREKEQTPGTQPDALEGPPRTKGLPFINFKPLPGMKLPKCTDTLVCFLKTFKFAAVSISVGAYCFTWYWWILSIITLMPVVYVDYSPETQGLFFLGLIIGTLVAEIIFSGRMSDWLVITLAKRNGGVKAPEMRLWLAYPGIILTAVGMVVWGVSADYHWHWAVDQVAFVLLSAGIQMGNTAICSYIVDAYPFQSMAVIVFYSVMINLSAFIDPFFITPWYNSVGYTWTFAGHAMISIFVCLPALALLHRFGGQIRERNGSPDWVDPGYDSDLSYTSTDTRDDLQVQN